MKPKRKQIKLKFDKRDVKKSYQEELTKLIESVEMDINRFKKALLQNPDDDYIQKCLDRAEGIKMRSEALLRQISGGKL